MAKKAQRSAKKSLVIVESPSKARTINRYLGDEYIVMASMGHVRDLPENDIGIDFERRFEPVYQVLAGKRKVVSSLKKAADQADTVYLATDLDREGEAIAWHLLAALGLDAASARRVVFNEITKSAIAEAFAHPHTLDMDKVNAQQARRLLDRIVGYELSPLLNRKIARGLSAGRVQSVAVRVVVEREREIRAFVPEESWSVHACFATEPSKADKHADAWARFLTGGKRGDAGPTVKQRNAWLSKHACVYAELVRLGDEPCALKTAEQAQRVVASLGYVVERLETQPLEAYADQGLEAQTLVGRTRRDAAPAFTILDIQKRRTTTKPSAPFTTAALQQVASTALRFAPSRTMRVAQQLYEGVDLGNSDGPVGLITYMRTDSTNLSKDSVQAARAYIKGECGDAYVPARPNVYGSAKRAQEAHEAIRPSDCLRTPASLKGHLSPEQLKLYDLIWRRFVACQMSPAQWDNTTIQIGADTSLGQAVFRASGRRLAFDGFLRVMGDVSQPDVVLPELTSGARVAVLGIHPKQQFTSPPPRYTEASLVKKLESEGIGRPSTYATIVQTVQDRGYVEQIDRKLRATERGEIVTDKLVEHFPKVMDVKFTSYMEDELDKIEDAHLEWAHVLDEFYGPFKASLDAAQANMEGVRAQPSDYTCQACGKPMVYRLGKNGRFLSCTGYPECKEAMNIDRDGKPVEAVVADEPCSACGKAMVLKNSRHGPFLGCSGYPECTNTRPCDEQGVPLRKVDASDIKETCPACGAAMNVKFARGRSFLGCSAYPKCKTTGPMPPGVYVEKPKPAEAGVGCDKCGRPMVIRTGRRGPFLSCSGFPRCRNAMPMDKIDHLRALAEAGKIPDPPPAGAAGSVGRKATGKNTKVDIAALGPPPPGFAWTRTGRPVVEVWPEEPLVCFSCGKDMEARTGRFGPFFSCPGCKSSANLRGEAKKRGEIEFPPAARPKPIPTDLPCDECGQPMVIRTGRSGPFLGCGQYPKCRHTQPLPAGQTAESLAATAK